MLGMDLFRNQADKIRADHDKRGIPHDRIDRVIELDEQWRGALKEMEESRRQRNQAARGIADAKKSGDKEESDRIMAEVKDLGDNIAALDYVLTPEDEGFVDSLVPPGEHSGFGFQDDAYPFSGRHETEIQNDRP